jgi:hypothetical protein
MISCSRCAILLSLAGLAGIIGLTSLAPAHPSDALALILPRPASPPRIMPVFAISDEDADPLVAFRSGLGLDLQSLVHESSADTVTAYPVNCTNAICRRSQSAQI